MKKLFVILMVMGALLAIGANPAAAGGINGVVLNAADEAVGGAMVVVSGLDRVRGTLPFVKKLESGDDGKFTVDDVPAGNYVAKACVRGTGLAIVRFEVAENAYADVTLKLSNVGGGDNEMQYGSMVGTVKDADGNAIAGAKVMLVQAAGRGHMRQMKNLNCSTDENGNFAIDKCPVGKYMVNARGPRGLAVCGKACVCRAEVLEGQETDIELVLKACQRRGGEGGGRNGGDCPCQGGGGGAEDPGGGSGEGGGGGGCGCHGGGR